MKMWIRSSVKVMLILIEYALGMAVTEVYQLIGVETCKLKCVETRDCRAAVYLTREIACKIFIKHSPISSDISKSSILVPLTSIPNRRCAKPCSNSSCIITKSTKQICRAKGIPACNSVYPVRHAHATITGEETGVTARYRCVQHYDVFKHPGAVMYASCTADKGWDPVRLRCRKVGLTKRELSHDRKRDSWNVKLPLKLEVNRHVKIRGYAVNVNQYSLNLLKGKSVMLHINPRFSQGKKGHVTRLFLNDSSRGTWGKDVERKNPFKENSPFSLTVFNSRKAYIINVGGKEVVFKKRVCCAAQTLGVSEGVVLSSVEMGKGRHHVSHQGL